MGSGRVNFGVMGLCALMVGMMMMMMMMAGSVAGQGQAPAPAPAAEDCSTALVALVDCLPYAMGQVSTPPATCCSNLSAIVNTSAPCLCQLYNTTFADSFGVNVTDALQLPSACKVSTPDPSLCAAFGIPVPGPAATSPAAPGVAPSSAPTPPAATSPSSASSPSSSGMTPNTTAASPPNPSSAPSVLAQKSAASCLLFAVILLFSCAAVTLPLV